VPGPVEERIRNSIKPGKKLTTPTGRASLKVVAYSETGIVLAMGERAARATISWTCLDAVPRFLIGRGSVALSGSFDPHTSTGTLETLLLAHGSSASPGALAAVLAAADIVVVEAARPASVRLKSGAADLATAANSPAQFSAGTRKMQEGAFRPHPDIGGPPRR
jgi:hypothetical protein